MSISQPIWFIGAVCLCSPNYKAVSVDSGQDGYLVLHGLIGKRKYVALMV